MIGWRDPPPSVGSPIRLRCSRDELRAASRTLRGIGEPGGHDDRDLAARRDPQHAEAQSPTEVAKTHVAFADPNPPGADNRAAIQTSSQDAARSTA